ncbi:unnamed protein product [Rotaria sp. Silwood2]|nr:unnamed protein product [Rotaria sp. Silwood2]CAF3918342.1 unnamed protein product [Rotaria sp. Silwood2]
MGYLRLLFNFLCSKIGSLNLYNTKSTNLIITRREIFSTRLFLITFAISLSIITIYNALTIHVRIETVKQPTQIEYEKLYKKYSNTLQCSCTQISIPYDTFLQVTPLFHQVCSSDFVSQQWIDFTFDNTTSTMWPMDVRTSMSSMWQLLAALCNYVNDTLIDALNELTHRSMISSMLLAEEVLQTETQAVVDLIRQTTAYTSARSFIATDKITQASGLLTGLLTNAITELPADGWTTSTVLFTGQTRYVQSGSTSICFCQSDRSCPMPGNLYLYKSWETYGLYNLTIIIANETLSGIVVDCLPFQMMFASSLECFYNQSCLDIFLSAYSERINVSILNKTISSRFLPETKIEYLAHDLFIEQIINKTIYESYYRQCFPISCTYTISCRSNVIYITTNIIGLIGGLSVALRLICLYSINFLSSFFEKQILQTEPIQIESKIKGHCNEY